MKVKQKNSLGNTLNMLPPAASLNDLYLNIKLFKEDDFLISALLCDISKLPGEDKKVFAKWMQNKSLHNPKKIMALITALGWRRPL